MGYHKVGTIKGYLSSDQVTDFGALLTGFSEKVLFKLRYKG